MNPLISRAIEVLNNDGVCAIPTDTVYGLAADATNIYALKKISKIKKRPIEKKYVIAVGSIEKALELVASPEQVLPYFKKYWPGEMTFICKKKENLTLPFLEETIAIRIPNNSLTKKLLNQHENPIALTSINISGQQEIINYKEISKQINDQLDYVLPYEGKLSGVTSTIVDLTSVSPKILRQGLCSFNQKK